MRAARDNTHSPAACLHRGAMAEDAGGLALQPDQGPARAAGLDRGQSLAADKVALAELDRPAEARLVWVDRLVHVVAVEAKRGLQPRRVAGPEAGGQHARRLAGFQDRVPDLSDQWRCDEELETVFARVAGPRDHGVLAADLALPEREVLDVVGRPVGGHQLGGT